MSTLIIITVSWAPKRVTKPFIKILISHNITVLTVIIFLCANISTKNTLYFLSPDIKILKNFKETSNPEILLTLCSPSAV